MPPTTLPAAAGELRRGLLDWYDRHRRRLPWRSHDGAAEPYRVLVSEVMLQQTTVAAVAPRYGEFLQRFPTVGALADAPLEAVLHAWQGLGYYRRARALHACARIVQAEFDGHLPADPGALAGLPGLGPYTTAALAAIAFGQPVVPVDGNVERVIARLAGLAAPPPGLHRQVTQLVSGLAAADRPGDFAQALMDLGALVCTPRSPGCLACPWRAPCRARAAGAAESLPTRAPRTSRRTLSGTTFLLRRSDQAILFRRRPMGGLLPGMVELPSTPWVSASQPDGGPGGLDADAPARAAWHLLDGRVVHLFTHLALTMRVAVASVEAPDATGFWVPPERFGELALPSLTCKLLAHAGLPVRPGRRVKGARRPADAAAAATA